MNKSVNQLFSNVRERIQKGLSIYRDSRKSIILISLLYFLLYLISTRSLTYTRDSTGIEFGSINLLFRGSGLINDEPIVKIVIEPVALFISPLNIAIGTILGLLVAVNLLLLYLVVKQPDRCNISDTTGLLASVPALLSGTACCGPIIPIILGIQVTSTLTSLLNIVIPVAFIVLLVSIYILLGHVRSQPTRS